MNKHSNNTMRFNITLPSDIGSKLKKTPNHSAYIAKSLRENFAREEKERMAAVLKKAYQESALEDKKIANDWGTTTGDGQ